MIGRVEARMRSVAPPVLMEPMEHRVLTEPTELTELTELLPF